MQDLSADKQQDVDRRIEKIRQTTPADIVAMWPFEPYYNAEKDVIIMPTPQKKKDGTLKGGVLHQIVGAKRASEVQGYQKAAVSGMLRGAKKEARREAWALVVEKQTERALADDGNVQAAVFVGKAIGAFAREGDPKVVEGGVQINISPELAREILDRMQNRERASQGNIVDAL